jgi:hypothetical protein
MQEAQATRRTDDLLSQADIILPSQYFAFLGSVGLSGEQRLMLAVLVDAINVLQSWQTGGGARKRRNFAEAAQWVNSCGTSHPFSFDSVCDALEIDSELLRSRLRGLTVRLGTAVRRLAPARLRLKELSRSQHMTANRLRRRERVPRVGTVMIAGKSELATSWDEHAEHVPPCTAGANTGCSASGEDYRDAAAGRSADW